MVKRGTLYAFVLTVEMMKWYTDGVVVSDG